MPMRHRNIWKFREKRMNIMTIQKEITNELLTVRIEGRLDTTTAPQLEESLKASMEDASRLVLDFAKLDYISSAGLRVLLSAQKVMNKRGGMIVRGANENVMEVFDVTGFSDILTIE